MKKFIFGAATAAMLACGSSMAAYAAVGERWQVILWNPGEKEVRTNYKFDSLASCLLKGAEIKVLFDVYPWTFYRCQQTTR